jgi:hypothetical protein
MSKLPIPRGALDWGSIVLGKTRSGKSSTIRVCVEALDDEHQRYCIITPKDDWWGLKLGADGKSPGRGVVIFGGEYADIPINEHAGKHIGELVATGNRPCIVTLSELSMGKRARFFIDFAETMFKLNRGRIYLVIDECHNFAPKGKMFDPTQAEMLHWANRLASEGLGRGITLLSASQRPQKVHNDYLTSHETLIAKKVTHKSDRDADKDWIEGCGDETSGKELIQSVANLSRAEAWVWSPEVKFGPKLVTFPFYTTYDSFKHQPLGGSKLKGWAAVDLEEVKTKLGAVVEESKANDPKTLKAEIAALKAELAKKATPAQPSPKAAPADDTAARQATFARGQVQGHETAWPQGWLAGHERGFIEGTARAAEYLQVAHKELSEAISKRQHLGYDAPKAPKTPKPEFRSLTPAVETSQRPSRTTEFPKAPVQVNRIAKPADSEMSKGARKILVAIAQHPDGLSAEGITVIVGYRATSRGEYLRQLKASGYIVEEGENYVATDAGLDALGDFEPLPTGLALRKYWQSNLSGGELTILNALIQNGPSMTLADLQVATDYKATSTREYVRQLKARKLVYADRGGLISLSERLS